jgi:hypothetical protein
MKLVVLLLACSCGFTHGEARVDAGSGSDAAAPRKQMEVVAGAGRLAAGTITLDVQIGRAVPLDKTTAGTITISGAPVVKP